MILHTCNNAPDLLRTPNAEEGVEPQDLLFIAGGSEK